MTTLSSACDWTVRAMNTLLKSGYNSMPPACIYTLVRKIITGKIQCGAKTLEEFAAFEIKYFGPNEVYKTPIECVKWHMRMVTEQGEKIRDFFVEYYSKR